MADSIKATEQDPFIAKLADLLGQYKGMANEVLKHRESGYGLGNVLVGDAPELLTDMSYGSPPWRGKGYGTVLDPRLIDVLGMSIPGAGLAVGAGKAVAGALRKGVSGGMKAGRRDFLKKAGAGAAVAALPAKAAMSMLGDVATPRVATKVAAKATGTDWDLVRKAIMGHFKDYMPEKPTKLYDEATDDFITKMRELGEFEDQPPEFFVRMLTNDHFGYGPAGPYKGLGTDPRLKWYAESDKNIPPDFVQSEFTGAWHHPDIYKWYNEYSYATPEGKAWLDKQDPYDVLKWWWTRQWPEGAPIQGFDAEYLARTMNGFPTDHPKSNVVESLHKLFDDLSDRDPSAMGWETFMED